MIQPALRRAWSTISSASSRLTGKSFKLAVNLTLPDGFHVNPAAPMPVLLEAPANPEALGSEAPANGTKITPPRTKFEVDVPLAKAPDEGDSLVLRLSVSSFECKEGAAGFCQVKNYVWNIPVNFSGDGSKSLTLTNSRAEAK